ncbi:MAG: Gfo/Idh/MocA family oxidoreductase [Tannerella sp.]|jgi:predicted dehydrogenase|nr:Gfo/Idh/MocA family oxidoreductase [Tannerella sp.]
MNTNRSETGSQDAFDTQTTVSRRDFVKTVGLGGLAAMFPWLQACTNDVATAVAGEKVRIGIIGTGSRGMYHINNLLNMPQAEVIALCDDYEPHLQNAAALYPKAKTYDNYCHLLDNKDIQAVMIVTPLNEHEKMAVDALSADKHVFCEKSIALTTNGCRAVYDAYRKSGMVLYIGQQRLFDTKYIRAMEMIHSGLIGTVTDMRAYWYRNNDWRRPVPSPDLERRINWRLYRASSAGLVTELAAHQLQVGDWALGMHPDYVSGFGDLIYWKQDAREVYDSISLVYHYPNGVKMSYESVISNKFLGLEELILGDKGSMELEKGKYYFENAQPAPGILQLINQIEHGIFDNVSFAGPSWVPETASINKGYFVTDKVQVTSGESSTGSAVDDGSAALLNAFCNAAVTGQKNDRLVEEAYYSSVLALLGLQAMEEQRVIKFPDELKV